MLQSLTIKNFKRFKELQIPELKRVNLIAGKNNTGKTGVLEALFLLLNGNEPERLPELFRKGAAGNTLENFWKWQFHNHAIDTSIALAGLVEGNRSISVTVSFGSQPGAGFEIAKGFGGSGGVADRQLIVQVAPTAAGHPAKPKFPLFGFGLSAISGQQARPEDDARLYDRVVLRAGGEERLETLLREIDGRVKSIRSIKPYDAQLLYVDVGLSEKIPAMHLGQGFLRLISIYSELIAGNKKVLLIDEVENGLHHSILKQIWTGLLKVAEQEGVQIFATTHSYECIQAAHSAFAETLDYDFALHRLEEVKGEIRVTTYNRETLETSLENNFEVR